MKVIYIHQYFRTPQEGGAIRSYYLAKGLVENGIEVELITSYNKKSADFKVIDGIKVHYLPVFYENEQGFLSRLVAFFKFMYLAKKKAKEIGQADIVYATSTPLTIGLIALKIKQQLKIPYYFEVRDLWPEAPFQMGIIKNKYLKKYLKSLERKVYKHAEKIVALSPGIKAIIQSENPELEVEVIPNMSDVDFFVPEHKHPDLEELFDVKDKFVVSYFGAIGLSNHLEFLLAAANATLKTDLPVVFFIIGRGSELNKLKYLTKHFDLSNVRFLDFQNKYNLKRILNVTDAAYVSFAARPILETNSPNKFFDALASGKLIITNTRGWVTEICEANSCGFYYDPDQPEHFVEQLTPFVQNRVQLEVFQSSAREVGETQFARDTQVRKLVTLLHEKTS
jgi:glycosyltransferase involved in cell wall biosynthesis